MFSHKFVGESLVLAGEVVMGELVAVQALMSAGVWSIENGKTKAALAKLL